MVDNAQEPPSSGTSNNNNSVDVSTPYLAITNAIGSSNFIVLGGHWFLFPDTSVPVLQKRLAVTSALALIGHYVTPVEDHLTGISSETSSIAFLTGGMMSTGFTMLVHKHAACRWQFWKRCVGGTLLNFGLSLWVPAVVRLGWQFNHTYLTADITTTGMILNTCKGVLIGMIWDIVSNIVNKSVSVGVSLLDQVQDKASQYGDQTATEKESISPQPTSIMQMISSVLCRPMGGGLFMLGMYLWLPPVARGYFDVSVRIRRIVKIAQFVSSFVRY